jgi:long-chain acyl-CoA synthetase
MDLARLVLTDARDEDETFGVEGARRYTRKETLERTYRLANALLSLGIGKKDKVAIMAYNGNEFMETLLASSILGAIMIPVNWHFRGRELSYCLGEKFSPKVLIQSFCLL